MRCAAYCKAEHYALNDLAQMLEAEGVIPKFYDDVLHIAQKGGDVFVFAYGSVCFWGFKEKAEQEFLEKLEPFQIKPYPITTKEVSSFTYGGETIVNEEEDTITLGSEDGLIKLSLAHGLAQSVKLEIFEKAINKTIQDTRYLPTELAQKGKISLSRRKIAQQIGTLFIQRNSINLETDILDQPEFFWRRPSYEPFYHMASSYMDITRRLDILNRKLDVIHELYEILLDELKHAHSSFLEIIIIGLIVTEVLLVILLDVLKLH